LLVLWLLLALVPVVSVAYVVWAYRKNAADKDAASRERLTFMLGTASVAAERPPEQAPVAAPPAKPEALWLARQKLLTPPESVLYYLLKTGLPDHEIFAHVGLEVLVEAGRRGAAYDREQRQRRLAQHAVSFVVCNKSMRAVAAIELIEGAARPDQALKAECLGEAGIRLVVVEASALPRRDKVRQLVLGA
jgi:hypothetical protein